MLVFCLHICLSEGVRFPRTGVTDRCKLQWGCWELNPGPLQEQSVLLTTEPSPSPRTQVLLTVSPSATIFGCFKEGYRTCWIQERRWKINNGKKDEDDGRREKREGENGKKSAKQEAGDSVRLRKGWKGRLHMLTAGETEESAKTWSDHLCNGWH